MSDKEDLRRRFDQAIEAWHASPYDFEEFGPMRKVSGTGQGVASYGRGAAYVAENPKVSGPGESEYMKEFANHPSLQGNHRWQIRSPDDHNQWLDLMDDSYDEDAKPDTIYNDARHDFGRTWVLSHLSNHDQQNNPESLDHLRDLLKDGQAHKLANPKTQRSEVADLTDFMNLRLWWVAAKWDSYDDNHATMVADYLEKHADQELRHVKDPGKQGPFSYKVAVHLKPETMLDWDEVIGDHHKDAKTKIAQAYDQHVGLPQKSGDGKVNYMEASDGAGVYREFVKALGGDYAASEALFNAGIHGIRYKDQGSRNPKATLHLNDAPVVPNPSVGTDDHAGEIAYTIRNVWRMSNLTKIGLRKKLEQDVEFVANELENAKYTNPGSQRVHELRDLLKTVTNHYRWVQDNFDKIELKYPKPTYNYVIFHPDFVEAMAQYNIKGEKIRDIGPGVHLKTADHDPFKGEDK